MNKEDMRLSVPRAHLFRGFPVLGQMDIKARFSEDKTLIRANQGHSVKVDVELKECEPPEQLFHGTGERFAAAIS